MTYLINHTLLEIQEIGDSRPSRIGNYDIYTTKSSQCVPDEFLNG
jgi:hypothetical protein